MPNGNRFLLGARASAGALSARNLGAIWCCAFRQAILRATHFLKSRDSFLNSEESIREGIALWGAPEERKLGLESGAAEGTRTPTPSLRMTCSTI